MNFNIYAFFCLGICVRNCSCPLFQESGTKPNLTWPLVSCGLWPKTCMQAQTHANTLACKSPGGTGHTLFLGPAEGKEVRAGGHKAPTVSLPVTCSQAAASPAVASFTHMCKCRCKKRLNCFLKNSAALFDCFVLEKFSKTCRPDRKQWIRWSDSKYNLKSWSSCFITEGETIKSGLWPAISIKLWETYCFNGWLFSLVFMGQCPT